MLSLEHLAGLLSKYPDAARARVREFTLGETFFAFNSRPAIMGVINLSPDSWYRESVCLTAELNKRRSVCGFFAEQLFKSFTIACNSFRHCLYIKRSYSILFTDIIYFTIEIIKQMIHLMPYFSCKR